MRPIETRFAGYRFRSRLEAKWAVFYTALEFRFDPEPEGYELEDGQGYLPDLKVRTPQNKTMWVEVKPGHIEADPKFTQFQKELESQERAFLASGDPLDFIKRVSICPRCGMLEARESGWQRNQLASRLSFTEYCFHCDRETPSGGGHPVREDGVCGTKYRPHKGDILVQSDELLRLEKKLLDAARKAREARFEHGESP